MYTFKDRLDLKNKYNKNNTKHPYDYIDYNLQDKMSVPEMYFWNYIRSCGLYMYFEYPISKYFVDLADPKTKICIEIDGKQWHSDEEKDKKRQKEIEKEGWRVFRIDANVIINSTKEEPLIEQYGGDIKFLMENNMIENYVELYRFLNHIGMIISDNFHIRNSFIYDYVHISNEEQSLIHKTNYKNKSKSIFIYDNKYDLRSLFIDNIDDIGFLTQEQKDYLLSKIK